MMCYVTMLAVSIDTHLFLHGFAFAVGNFLTLSGHLRDREFDTMEVVSSQPLEYRSLSFILCFERCVKNALHQPTGFLAIVFVQVILSLKMR